MNRIIINVDALRHNLRTIDGWVRAHGGSLTVVTKALCGNAEAIQAIQRLGARSVGDSRVLNLAAIDRALNRPEVWYLRPVHMSAVSKVVALADVSLNSEIETLHALDSEAARQRKRHKVVVMVEMGDLREGVLPGRLADFYRDASALPHIQVIGLGANLGCLSGAIPGLDQLHQLAMYHELIELKFGRKLPILSAGTSAALPLLCGGDIPARINHFRVGESILLGTDLMRGGTLPGLRDDAALLEAEVVEVKQKSLTPVGEFAELASFGASRLPAAAGSRGYRALVTVGHVDTDIDGLRPVDPAHAIAGATSDITVVNVGGEGCGLSPGDLIRFRMGYSSFVRLMGNPYTVKTLFVTGRSDRRTSAAARQTRLAASPKTDTSRLAGFGR